MKSAIEPAQWDLIINGIVFLLGLIINPRKKRNDPKN